MNRKIEHDLAQLPQVLRPSGEPREMIEMRVNLFWRSGLCTYPVQAGSDQTVSPLLTLGSHIFQLITQRHQLIDLGDYPMLLF